MIGGFLNVSSEKLVHKLQEHAISVLSQFPGLLVLQYEAKNHIDFFKGRNYFTTQVIG